MTSSLVGSEMCIRDSPNGLLGSSATVATGAASSVLTTVTPSTLMQTWACLLYTSDAADDM
eukprot:5530693-Prorocentrum_lima.AAC.1